MGTGILGARGGNSLRMKLFAFMLPGALAAAAAMGWASRRVAASVLTEQLARKARERAAAFSELPEVQGGLSLRRESAILPYLQLLIQSGVLYAAALDPEGRVVAHSDILEKGKVYAGPPDLIRRLETPDGPVLEASVPVWAGSDEGEEFVLGAGQAPRRRLGTVRVGLPLKETLETASRVSRQVIGAVLGVNAVFLALLVAFLSRTVRPLRALAGAAERLGAGRVGETVPVSSSDEIGELARSFNRMSLQLARITVSKAELDAKVAELARSNQELEEYAFVASHDLQEPLRKIGGFTELLGRRYQGRLDADADRYLRYITDGSRRMQALLKDILSLSQVRREPLSCRPFELDAVLSEVLARLEPELKEAGAGVVRGPLPTVAADPRQIALLLENLVANAVKFRRPEPLVVRVSARDEGARWVVSVGDNGIGVEPRHLDRLFVLFQRLHAKDAFPGTGVGLALCKKIVERHGGRIWAESAVGVGTTIHFTLPKAAPPPEAA